MDGVLIWILGAAMLAGLGVTAGSAVVLALPQRRRRESLPWLLSYASGTLLGAAFLELIPKALSGAPAPAICGTVLAGIVGFFILEKAMLWRHDHGQDPSRLRPQGALILLGDAFHNLADGVVIASAFLVSAPLGLAVTLAVIAHEVPQEVGDFAILLDSGYSRGRAILFNVLSAGAALPGALLGYLWLEEFSVAIPYVLALSAASFVYIATADLIPMLNSRIPARASVFQIALMLAGLATIAIAG